MKISTSLNIIYGRNNLPCDPSLMGEIARAGFDGLDFNFLDFERDVDWFDEYAADAFVDSLAAAAEEHGLAWSQGHAPIYNFFISNDVVGSKHALCEPAMRAAARLKVPWMVFHPSEHIGYDPSTQKAEAFEKNIEHFKEMLTLCEKYEVGMALENMPSDFVGVFHFARDASELCELTDTLNHPLVGNCWDTGHARINDLDQKKEITLLGSRLKVLHIQDNNGTADSHLVPFTHGPNGVDWKDVSDGLRAIGYDGYVNLEAHNSFSAVPDSSLYETIKYSAQMLRHI